MGYNVFWIPDCSGMTVLPGSVGTNRRQRLVNRAIGRLRRCRSGDNLVRGVRAELCGRWLRVLIGNTNGTAEMHHGGRSVVVNTSGCGPEDRGFDPLRSPHASLYNATLNKKLRVLHREGPFSCTDVTLRGRVPGETNGRNDSPGCA